MKLYGYFRSSAAFRVRIALNLKELDYDSVRSMRRGDQATGSFAASTRRARAGAGGSRTDPDPVAADHRVSRRAFPEPPLLPRDPAGRARVRALAAIVACDIHPLNNLRVLRYLQRPLGHDHAAIETWYNHWIGEGFGALERLLAADNRTGRFCHGDRPGLADIALVPQVVNAERYRLDLAPYPTITRIFETCMTLDAFAAAHPQRQPDFEA